MKTKTTLYCAAAYMRISKEDDDNDKMESSSILTQKKILDTYAKENGIDIFDYYADDGWSGTNFNRPDFKRMIEDIEKRKVNKCGKKINMVITKDLSRLGRNYITTGQYTEIYFPENGIRYVAIIDGYDSNSPYNDMAPFKNVINELYARVTSKNIRSAFNAKMEDGDYIGNFAPYGYKKDENNKNKLVIDPYSATIVREIFSLALNGNRPKDIAKKLNSDNIMSPAVYRCFLYPNLNIDNYSKNKEWTSSAVSDILTRETYLGHNLQGKTSKLSFKSNQVIQIPREDWIVKENMHDAIIDNDTFEKVAQYRITRTNKRSSDFRNIFSGIAKCADCGGSMSTTGTRKKGAIANLVCGTYKYYGNSRCTNHFIDYETLYDIVLNELKKQINLSDEERNDILKVVKGKYKNTTKKEINIFDNKDVQKLIERSKELDNIIKRLYEDNISGKISNERFEKLMKDYEKEQAQINLMIEKSNLIRTEANEQEKAYINYFNLLNEIIELNELTSDLLFKLIEKIEIGQGKYIKTSKGKVKQQSIKIYYRFIGKMNEKEYLI